MKLSIVYHSVTGNTKAAAALIEEGAKTVLDIETLTMPIEEIDHSFLNASKCIIFGTPTYLGTFSWQMKQFLDKELQVNLAGKLGGVFATEKYLGGGADIALHTILGHLLVKGMLVYSSGVSFGQPFIHYGPVCIQKGTPEQKERVIVFGKRMAEKSRELFVK